MTGMRVMPMTTVSGPASSDEGAVMPWLMWCSGLAESSSPLMTATGPAHTKRDTGPGEAAPASARYVTTAAPTGATPIGGVSPRGLGSEVRDAHFTSLLGKKKTSHVTP